MGKDNNVVSVGRAVWAGAAAWAIPGLGHVLLGHRLRGVVLGTAVLATFWFGMAVGGVMTVDSRYENWWWYAQSGAGISGVVGWVRQDAIYRRLEEDPAVAAAIQQRYDQLRAQNRQRAENGMPLIRLPRPGQITASVDDRPDGVRMAVDAKLVAAKEGNLALVNPGEGIARAYTGVAGMLNVLCVFDAVMLALMGSRPKKRAEKREATS